MTPSGGAHVGLPRGLLRRPDFMTACRDRDFGAVFAMVRKYGGISQVRIAAALDMTPSRVGEVIRGQRQVTSIEVIERVSDRLRIPGQMLGLAPRFWEAAALAASESGQAGLEDIAAILGDEALDVTADAAVRLAHTWLATEPPQSRELRAGRRVGSGLVHRVEARIHHLRRMDDYIGGRDSLAIVAPEVEVTAALLRGATYPDPVRAALLAALAELCQLTGWVLDDAGQHEQAIRYYVTGVRAAEEAGDRSLAANLLSTLSYSRANTGHTEEAVLLARSAVLAGGPHSAPAGRALLWDRAAWAHALNGDADRSNEALEAADEAFALADGEPAPAWAYWLTRGELDVMAGRCFTELDRPDRAEPLLLNAIANYDLSRSREVALYRSWLAEAYAKAGDVEQACGQSMRVLDAVEGVNSARVDDRVVILRRALRPYADASAVRKVEERSRALMRIA
jgi:transcriptional regulator with XRE-family HTH domain